MTAVLADHVDTLVGFAFKSADFRSSPPGVRLIRGDNVTEGRVRWGEKTRYWPGVTADLERYLLRTGDVVVGMDGSKVGRNWAAIRESDLPALLVQRVACLRARPTLDQGFLALLVSSEEFKRHVNAVRTGSSIPHVSAGQIGEFTFDLLPIDAQRRAASLVGAIDDKIELNRRMSETLEAIARTLFNSWFAGGDAAATLGDVADQSKRAVKSSEIDSDAAYIGLEHMPRRSIALNEWASAGSIISNKLRFDRGEILFGKLRPYFHKVGVAPLDGICSTDIVVLRPKVPELFSFVLLTVSSDNFVAYTDSGSTGTKMPRTNWDHMRQFRIALPSGARVAEFDALVRPMIERIVLAAHESRALATLRDVLLPKLISGELRVGDLPAA